MAYRGLILDILALLSKAMYSLMPKNREGSEWVNTCPIGCAIIFLIFFFFLYLPTFGFHHLRILLIVIMFALLTAYFIYLSTRVTMTLSDSELTIRAGRLATSMGELGRINIPRTTLIGFCYVAPTDKASSAIFFRNDKQLNRIILPPIQRKQGDIFRRAFETIYPELTRAGNDCDKIFDETFGDEIYDVNRKSQLLILVLFHLPFAVLGGIALWIATALIIALLLGYSSLIILKVACNSGLFIDILLLMIFYVLYTLITFYSPTEIQVTEKGLWYFKYYSKDFIPWDEIKSCAVIKWAHMIIIHYIDVFGRQKKIHMVGYFPKDAIDEIKVRSGGMQ